MLSPQKNKGKVGGLWSLFHLPGNGVATSVEPASTDAPPGEALYLLCQVFVWSLLSVGFGSKAPPKISFLWKSCLAAFNPVHEISPSGYFLLVQPPILLPLPLATSAYLEPWGMRPGHRHGISLPYPCVTSRQMGLALKPSGIDFSLWTQPISLAPWPLSVMNFIIKIQFILYTVPPMRRPGSLCSFLWILIRSWERLGQGRSKPSRVLPLALQAPQALASVCEEWCWCSSWKDPLFHSVPWCSDWSHLPLTPALGRMHWCLTQHLTSGPPKQPRWEMRPRKVVPETEGKRHLPSSVSQVGKWSRVAVFLSVLSSFLCCQSLAFPSSPLPFFLPQTFIKQMIFITNVSWAGTVRKALC